MTESTESTEFLEEFFSEAQIRARVKELGRQISLDYQGKPLVMVCVLKGAFIFFSDLVRQVDLELEVDFLRVSSYGAGDTSSGEVRFSKDVEIDLRAKDVLLVDDIVDSGLTMDRLRREILTRGVNSLRIAALIDKFERREKEVSVDYAGFSVSDGFFVGYGLDYAERHRQKASVCVLVQKD
ncbi:MAG: hypoxanthine phosphoribosyltransferase [Desulfovibrio sp.]|nr:hypoxanthine phosphoribosyltransferase [Desulfovibrio sp.]